MLYRIVWTVEQCVVYNADDTIKSNELTENLNPVYIKIWFESSILFNFI